MYTKFEIVRKRNESDLLNVNKIYLLDEHDKKNTYEDI